MGSLGGLRRRRRDAERATSAQGSPLFVAERGQPCSTSPTKILQPCGDCQHTQQAPSSAPRPADAEVSKGHLAGANSPRLGESALLSQASSVGGRTKAPDDLPAQTVD